MDEYIIDVLNDGEKQQLKTYANTVYQALDSMLSFQGISKIYKIVRSKDKESWNVTNSNLKYLREMREIINDEKLIQDVLKDTK
jgi:hypothetical protein